MARNPRREPHSGDQLQLRSGLYVVVDRVERVLTPGGRPFVYIDGRASDGLPFRQRLCEWYKATHGAKTCRKAKRGPRPGSPAAMPPVPSLFPLEKSHV
jgi:hypothetical protein